MLRKSLQIFLALYVMIFFAVIVPAHRRGSISITGNSKSFAGCCCCCCGGADKSGKPQSSKDCAICYIAAHVTVPPVVDFTLPSLGLLCVAPIPVAEDRVMRTVLVPFDGRAPPQLT